MPSLNFSPLLRQPGGSPGAFAVERTEALPAQARDAVQVSSVDAFQGCQKDVIILSLVRANPRQETQGPSDPQWQHYPLDSWIERIDVCKNTRAQIEIDTHTHIYIYIFRRYMHILYVFDCFFHTCADACTQLFTCMPAYPLVIKHGSLENSPLTDDLSFKLPCIDYFHIKNPLINTNKQLVPYFSTANCSITTGWFWFRGAPLTVFPQVAMWALSLTGDVWTWLEGSKTSDGEILAEGWDALEGWKIIYINIYIYNVVLYYVIL